MSNEQEIIDVGSDTGSDDEQDWYFASKTAEIEGPYMESELRVLYQSGKIDESTHVWNTYENDLHRDWIPIEKIKHLYPTIFTMKPVEATDNILNTQADIILLEGAQANVPSEGVAEGVVKFGDDDPFAPFSKSLDDAPDQDNEDIMGRAQYVSAQEAKTAESKVESIVEEVRTFSEVKKNIGEDTEKTMNLHKPKPISNTANFDSVMKGIEDLENELKMQDAAVKGIDLNVNMKVASSSDETSSDEDFPIQMDLLDPKFAIASKPDAAVHRFTLKEAWSEGEEMPAEEKKSDYEAKFSILLVGNKLRKLDNILPNHTIAQMRTIVGRVEKVPAKQVMLLHKGEELSNDVLSLQDYNIPNGGTVVVKVVSPIGKRPQFEDANSPLFSNDSIYAKPLPEEADSPMYQNSDSVSSIPDSIPTLPSTQNQRKFNMNDMPAAISEEDMVLDAYPPDRKKTIRELVRAGFPQDSVIVALEITKFSKNYAMEWLLSEEMTLHRKHETKRKGKGPAIQKLSDDEFLPQQAIKRGNNEVLREDEKLQSDAWGCPMCTFANLNVMPYCEMCGYKKNSKPPPDLPERLSKRLVKQDLVGLGERMVAKPLEVKERDGGIPVQANDFNLLPKNIGPNEISASRVNIAVGENLPIVESIRSSQNVAASKNLIGSDRGNLKITLVAAVGLSQKASYCLLTLGKLTKKTKPLKKSKSLEFNEVFFFNGFKPERSRQLRIALMVENKMRADKVVGQVSYAMPTSFNTFSHDCIELTNQKNQTAGLLILSVIILQQ